MFNITNIIVVLTAIGLTLLFVKRRTIAVALRLLVKGQAPISSLRGVISNERGSVKIAFKYKPKDPNFEAGREIMSKFSTDKSVYNKEDLDKDKGIDSQSSPIKDLIDSLIADLEKVINQEEDKDEEDKQIGDRIIVTNPEYAYLDGKDTSSLKDKIGIVIETNCTNHKKELGGTHDLFYDLLVAFEDGTKAYVSSLYVKLKENE